MRLSITQLKIRALRSIKEATLVLPERGLLLVQGKNKDTGGSSGAGKSNLFQSVAFALGFSDYTGPELQSWFWEEAPAVEVALHRDGEEASTIIRCSKSRVAGPRYDVGGAKEIAAEIQRLCGGLKPEMVRALTYMRQDEQDSFLSLTSGQKFDFLTTLLPEIVQLEKVGAKAASEAALVEGRLAQLIKDLLAVHTSRDAQVAMLAAAQSIPQAEKDQAELLAQVEGLAAKLAAGQASYREVTVRRDAARVEHEKDLAAKLQPLEKRMGDVQLQVGQARAVLLPVALPARFAAELKLTESQATLAPLETRLGEAQLQLGNARAPSFAEPTPERKESERKLAGAQVMLEKALHQDEERQRAMAEERERLRQDYRDADQEVARLNVLAAQLPKLLADVAKLEKNICATCGQTWEEAEAEATRLRGAVAKISADLIGLSIAIAKRSALRAEGEALPMWAPAPVIEQVRAIQAQIKQRIIEIDDEALAAASARRAAAVEEAARSLKSVLQEISAIKTGQLQIRQQIADLDAEAGRLAGVKRGQAVAEAERLLADVRDEILQVKNDYASLAEKANEGWATFDVSAVAKMAQDLEALRKRAPAFDRQIAELRTMERVGRETLAQLEQRDAQVQAELKTAQEELKMHAGIAEVLSKRGFLSAIFQEVLDEISAETNGILAQVANTAEITIGFVTESETKSDTIRREIKAVSTVRGHMTSLKAGCSGGMLAAVRLAIQLAVRRVVSRRMGVFPGWLILDEPFNGLGEIEKMTCMEILKTVAAEDLVMVVDHATEFQELFDKVIVVEMARGVSTITEAA